MGGEIQFKTYEQDQAKRLKDLEKENGPLKRFVADQALDIAILKEAALGNL